MGKFARKQRKRGWRNRVRYHEVTVKFVIPVAPGDRVSEEAQVHYDALSHMLAAYYEGDSEMTGFDIVIMPKEYTPPMARGNERTE